MNFTTSFALLANHHIWQSVLKPLLIKTTPLYIGCTPFNKFCPSLHPLFLFFPWLIVWSCHIQLFNYAPTLAQPQHRNSRNTLLCGLCNKVFHEVKTFHIGFTSNIGLDSTQIITHTRTHTMKNTQNHTQWDAQGDRYTHVCTYIYIHTLKLFVMWSQQLSVLHY